MVNPSDAASVSQRQRGPMAAMGVGLLLTLAVLVALAIDQASVGSIATHVQEHYAPHGTVPDPTVLYVYLYVTGGIGVVTWLLLIAAARTPRSWVAVLATIVFCCGLGGGLFNLTISEYGGPVLPALWSGLTLLPCVAGLVAVVLLWRAARS
ncbi:hypothetical protein [Salinactinospora qingdaonensis]|uniref:Integral membrane protein n=1 Tax=Salinactinospora qingdaonensis TaxID=702744 RepID=A0ABP7FVJ6_9ACTN